MNFFMEVHKEFPRDLADVSEIQACKPILELRDSP